LYRLASRPRHRGPEAKFVVRGGLMGGAMRIIAFITDGPTVRDILAHLGAPTAPPRIAPARGPPLSDMPDARAGGFDPMPSRHRTMSSINPSLGNPDRRPPFAHDTGPAPAGGCRARTASSRPRAKHPHSGYRRLAATSPYPFVAVCIVMLEGCSRLTGGIGLSVAPAGITPSSKIAPQCNRQAPGQRYDANAPHPLATWSETLVEPLAQSAFRLIAQPTPPELAP